MDLSGPCDCARGFTTDSAKNSAGVARDLTHRLTGDCSADSRRDFVSDPAEDFAKGPTRDFVEGCSEDFTENVAEASMEALTQDLTGDSEKCVGGGGL